MNSVDTFHKRLRDEIAVVEKEIQSHHQQVEALTRRLEGLKRADELFESDQPAIAELLQSSIANGSSSAREMATPPAAAMQRAVATPKAPGAQKQLGRRTQIGRGSMQTGRARAGQNGGLTRVDMIAAVLKASSRPEPPRLARRAQPGVRLEIERKQRHGPPVHEPDEVRAHQTRSPR